MMLTPGTPRRHTAVSKRPAFRPALLALAISQTLCLQQAQAATITVMNADDNGARSAGSGLDPCPRCQVLFRAFQ